MKFSSQTRKDAIEQMLSNQLDVLIIGGGITGAGLAFHAGAKEMTAGLVEMQDFAAGTSSRSTKLIHGGLRYLKQFEVELVADVAQERSVIYRNAPHIVQPMEMLLPIYDEPGASFSEFSAEIALDLYDRLAEVEGEKENYFITREELLEENPVIKEEGLLSSGVYLDYLNDDARLTLDILKEANEMGIYLANYVKAVDFLYGEDDKITGIKAKDILTEETFDIHASVVVNATGPWADEIRNKQKDDQADRMYPTKGVHFVVDSSRLPVKRTIYTDTGLDDNRMIFIIPRKDKVYFGTTDTPYGGNLADPPITKEDVDYLLSAVNIRFPEASITINDIEAGWAGLRPLLLEEDAADPSDISRVHDVFVSNDGLVTIAGGKLTDYRRMAEDTFVTIEKELKKKTEKTYKEVDTTQMPLSGGDLPNGKTLANYIEENAHKGEEIGLSKEEAREMIAWYGTNSEIVFSLKDNINSEELSLKEALSLQYALEYEMTVTPIDYFLRRSDTLLFDNQQMDRLKEPILEKMVHYLKWDNTEKEKWEAQLKETIREIRLENLK